METCNRHGNDIIGINTYHVSSHACYIPLESLRSEEVNLKKMPEAICCYLQTCIVVILMLAIEYIMYTNFRSRSSYQL